MDGKPSRQIADARILRLNGTAPGKVQVERQLQEVPEVKLEVFVGVVVMLKHVAWETGLFDPLLRPLLAWRGPRDVHPLSLWDHPTADGVLLYAMDEDESSGDSDESGSDSSDSDDE